MEKNTQKERRKAFLFFKDWEVGIYGDLVVDSVSM